MTKVECEVVVLGAGITGALVADRLAKKALEVVVVDKREAASGRTSASTALLQYEIDGITFSAVAADIIGDAMVGRPNEQARLFRFDR